MSKYLIINIDQIDVVLILGETDNIYKIKEVKYVFIYRKTEKRAFTTILSIDLGSKVLLTQNIWKKCFL